jgi:hypothetical protein
VLRGAADPRQVALAFGIELRLVVIGGCVREAIDAAQRRSQIVRDRVAESLELAIRLFELARAFTNATLEIGIRSATWFARS